MSHPSVLRKRLSHLLPSILGLVLFGASVWAIAQEVRHYPPHTIWHSLTAIPMPQVGLAIGLMVLNYLDMTGYDALAVRYVGHPVAYGKTALAAVTSIAVSNSVGLGLFSGSAVRYRLYSASGVAGVAIVHIIAFCNLSFWLGLLVLGGLVFILEPVSVPALLNLPIASVRPLGAIFLIGVFSYLFWNLLSRKPLKFWAIEFPHLPFHLALGQVAIATVDWALAAAVFYALLPASTTLAYPAVCGIYLLAQIAGIISNVPGGLGVFETVMLLLLGHAIASTTLFGILLAYRVVYYLLPLSAAVLFLGLYEVRQRMGG